MRVIDATVLVQVLLNDDAGAMRKALSQVPSDELDDLVLDLQDCIADIRAFQSGQPFKNEDMVEKLGVLSA